MLAAPFPDRSRMAHASVETPAQANPLLVEVTRGDMVESRHRGALAVVDAAGRVVEAHGDIERPVYARSALKPLQALPLLESGAAERYAASDAEIALACASHTGETRHVEAVRAWLARIGLGVEDLECGSHMPADEAASAALVRAGARPSALHNNCSGKHTGFLATARHLGEPTRGYIRYEHPVQQRILGLLEQMTGLDLGQAPRGIDGCGIPVIGIPLGGMAMAMARLADRDGLPPARAAAAWRVVAAMAAEPFMVGGLGRFCSIVMQAAGDAVVLKTGAEGVCTGVLRKLGLGIALKIDDGAARAAEVAMGEALRRLGVLAPEHEGLLSALLTPAVSNRAGVEVGMLRPAGDPPSSSGAQRCSS